MSVSSKFLSQVLNTDYIGMVDFNPGSVSSQVQKDVTQLADELRKSVYRNDKRFKCSLLPSGSSVEKTKVGMADEFDFMFVLENFTKLIDVENIDQKTGLGNFIALKAVRNVPAEYHEFIDDGYISSSQVQLRFSVLVQQVLTSGGFMEKFSHLQVQNEWPGGNTTSSEISVKWVREIPHHAISIDLVASIFIPKWLGDKGTQNPIITNNVKKLGCHVVYKNTEFFGGIKIESLGHKALKSDRLDLNRSRVWRLSFSGAELSIFQRSVAGRDAYTLIKIFHQLLPSMCVTMRSFFRFFIQKNESRMYTSFLMRQEKYLEAKQGSLLNLVQPSYILKNIYFYILSDFITSRKQLNYSDTVVYIFTNIMSVLENYHGNQHLIQQWFFDQTVNLGFDMEKLQRGKGHSYPLMKDIKVRERDILRKVQQSGVLRQVAEKISSDRKLYKQFKMDARFIASLPARIDLKAAVMPVIDEGPIGSQYEQQLYLNLQFIVFMLHCLPANDDNREPGGQTNPAPRGPRVSNPKPTDGVLTAKLKFKNY